MQAEPAWSTQSLNPRRSANMFAVDGRETWLIHNYLRADETDFATVDRDRCIRQILGVGPDFEYQVLTQEDWIGRRLLADKFRDRRVFICGDAAHIWVPFAGYGMNAGIADAMNLSWMLAGVLQGWAEPAILDAHEAERWPITEQVSRYAMNTAASLARARAEVPTNIEDEGPEGDAVRERFGRAVYELNVPQYCCGGLNFGYFYDRSPIIAHDGEAAPPYSMYDYHAVHHARMSHAARLAARRSIAVRCDGPRVHIAAVRSHGSRGRIGRCCHKAQRATCRSRCGSITALCAQARPVAARPARSLARQCAAGRCYGADRPDPRPASSGTTFRMNSVRLCATSSYAIGPSRNCMITPPTPMASTFANASATVAGEP